MKIFLVVVAVILVGLIIAWSTGVFKDKKNDLDKGTERINNAINSIAEFDLLYYDGGTISGRALLEIIQEKADDSKRLEDVTISYITLENGNETEVSSPYEYTDINPNGIFIGKISRDNNNVITGLIFTQQK